MNDLARGAWHELLSEPTLTEAGTRYEAWTDGRAVGFKCTLPSRQVRYIYLNPSDDGHDEGDTPNVFVYIGESGVVTEDVPQHYYAIDMENNA